VGNPFRQRSPVRERVTFLRDKGHERTKALWAPKLHKRCELFEIRTGGGDEGNSSGSASARALVVRARGVRWRRALTPDVAPCLSLFAQRKTASDRTAAVATAAEATSATMLDSAIEPNFSADDGDPIDNRMEHTKHPPGVVSGFLRSQK
jgi:hypothetical protein